MTTKDLIRIMVDVHGAEELAEMYISLVCGMNIEEPGIEESEGFKGLVSEYEEDEE